MGGEPDASLPSDCRRALLQVREAAAGEAVGYGATHTLRRATRIGTVALGYADGFLRRGGDRATLYHNGQSCPVIGRVSMDLVTVALGGGGRRSRAIRSRSSGRIKRRTVWPKTSARSVTKC